MGPVWLSLRAELRLRRRALTGLALLLGLIAGRRGPGMGRGPGPARADLRTE
jgi:hypothetical protein